jgi:transcriptional regulator with XRE-family HTH domain
MAAVTRAKKRLGGFLLDVRRTAGKSLVDAGAELKTSDSTVSRYESGLVLPVWAAVLILLNYYGAAEDQRERATQLWEAARDAAPPVRLPAGTHRTFRQLVNAERDAETERSIELAIIPGLLQTKRYARDLVTAGHRFADPAAQVDAVIATRLARQDRLNGPDPLRLHAVIDEAAIRRVVGSEEVMREQLGHLLKVSEQDNVMLQVVPFGSGSYGLMSGSCIIVGYADGDVPGVYLEYPAGGAWVENEDDVGRFTAMFEDVVRAALTPEDTADLIRRQLGALVTDDERHKVAQE